MNSILGYVIMGCPQCGEFTERLYDGYCWDCREENEHRLFRDLMEKQEWDKLSDSEKRRIEVV
ncbi:hypothetical protein [Leptospira mayottensis]|uniref:hypothetical protein n=1 Tax=Leptospira mayottensis TaxID=1137606 RepID=UPI0013C2E120|nr:hypothetical protein [Leptospira mayottensis]